MNKILSRAQQKTDLFIPTSEISEVINGLYLLQGHTAQREDRQQRT